MLSSFKNSRQVHYLIPNFLDSRKCAANIDAKFRIILHAYHNTLLFSIYGTDTVTRFINLFFRCVTLNYSLISYFSFYRVHVDRLDDE